MTKLIPLSNGGVALVDDEDFAGLSRRTWRTVSRSASRRSPRPLPYVIASNRYCRFVMHRVILGIPTGDSRQVDHVNGDTLDNRRSNLRVATPSQNQANRKHLTKNTSGFRGVTFHKQSGRWQAQVKVDGRSLYLGLFATPAEAGAAYSVKAREIFGEFAA